MSYEILYSLLMGLLQGLTEWLPVSSSGHLVLAQVILAVKERTLFDAVLHLGTLCAALVYFRNDLISLLNIKNPMTHKIIIASIPIIIVGFLLRNAIEDAFLFAIIVPILLIINGCILMVNAWIKPQLDNEDNKKKKKEMNIRKIQMKHVIIIGVFQIFALFPGISRSGTTITTARVLGIDWAAAAKFSFFISFIPIAGAAGFKIATAFHEFNAMYLLGFLVAFLVGYATIELMMRILRLGKFHYFGIYTIVLGIVVLGILLAY